MAKKNGFWPSVIGHWKLILVLGGAIGAFVFGRWSRKSRQEPAATRSDGTLPDAIGQSRSLLQEAQARLNEKLARKAVDDAEEISAAKRDPDKFASVIDRLANRRTRSR